MKPCYALLPCGAFVALHLAHWFGVMPTDRPGATGFDVLCGAPGQEDLTVLYTWSAYPAFSVEETGRDGEPITINELAAEEMLECIMLYLAAGKGGLLDMNELAKENAENLGLEKS